MKRIIGIIALTSSVLLAQEPVSQEEYITRMVEMGIDAGINSCILKGIPTNKAALEHLKAKSKLLVQTLYPELQWQWKNPQPIKQGDGVTQDSAQTF